MRSWLIASTTFSTIALLAAACGVGSDCDFGLCQGQLVGSSGDGGDVQVSDSPADGPSDPCIDNLSDPKCTQETSTIFVSQAKGIDSNPGTKVAPFQTIGAALSKITPERRRIILCEGTYNEDISLASAHNGVSLFGGFDCDWNPKQTKPVLGSSANPFKIDSVTGLSMADLSIEAKDAQSGSSIALLVNASDVTLKRMRLVAGAGAKADTVTLTPFSNFPSQSTLNGIIAPDASHGGAPNPVTCPGGAITTGGKGGDLGNSGAPGLPGSPNGGTLSNCADNRDGQTGVSPAPAAGATVAGRIDSTGWVPQAGEPGANGGPGQGGGGGYGNAGGGGGGGAGGCGGAGGPGGKGGGASIALAASGGHVIVASSSVLIAKNGGTGGDGVAGQGPQPEAGFRGTPSGNACQGGAGGMGGTGAAGGGGAGGLSAAVVYKGSKPTIETDTSIQLGQSGNGGNGGGGSGKNGIAPDAANIYESK
jgi:hypothetical protein